MSLRVISFDIEYWDDLIIGLGLYSEDHQLTLQVVDDETNAAFDRKLPGFGIKTPDFKYIDDSWIDLVIEVVSQYDVIIGCNVHNDVSRFQRYRDLYPIFKDKVRCVGAIFSELENCTDINGRKKKGSLKEIMSHLGIDPSCHHDPLFDAKVCYEYYYSVDDMEKYLDYGLPYSKGKKPCPKCGLEFVRVSTHLKICKGTNVVVPIVRSKKSKQPWYYAVRRGKNVGIYNTWQECKEQIDHFSFPSYKKFATIEEAEAYLESCPVSSQPETVEKPKIVQPQEELVPVEIPSPSPVWRKCGNGYKKFASKQEADEYTEISPSPPVENRELSGVWRLFKYLVF